MMRPELEVRNGCGSLYVVLETGKLGTAFVPFELVEYVAKGPDWRLKQLLHLVPPILETPTAVFRGLRKEEPDWLAYVGKPKVDYEGFRDACEVPADPNHVFVVNLTDRREVYNFVWVEAEPGEADLPVGYRERYRERIL